MTEAASASIPQQARRRAAPDPAVRRELYTTMVLSRTYEEAILHEYHADKGPGFDIGKGLLPGEMHLSAGQEPVAAGVCAHLTTTWRSRTVSTCGR
jgi:pyruvate dehydrogenase E1 component alpha subunit